MSAAASAVAMDVSEPLDREAVVEPLARPKSPEVDPCLAPIRIHVTSMGGKHVEVQADPLELVAHLRRRIAKAVGKPLTQLVLALDAKVLHGMQLVGEALGESECVQLSAFLSHEGGPVEEWMDDDDPSGLTDYMPELYSKLKKQESQVQISATYMQRQSDITNRMRTILVDWLVEVHMKYRLKTMSLFLAVQLIDRYLQAKDIGTRKRLQLVGVASLLTASKFEDRNDWQFGFREVLYVCDGTYSPAEISKMEVDMLTTFGFSVSAPTAAHFMELYQRANRCDDTHCFAVQYLMELSLLDAEFASETPSKSAAAATLLSNQLLRRDVCWPAAMANYTGYTEEELQVASQKMRKLHAAPTVGSLQAVNRKFSHDNFGGVAVILQT